MRMYLIFGLMIVVTVVGYDGEGRGGEGKVWKGKGGDILAVGFLDFVVAVPVRFALLMLADVEFKPPVG